MNIFNCLHPKKIFNPYIGEEMMVPCGKCTECRRRRSVSWSDRLEAERHSHEYCAFVTLTFDNNHLFSLRFEDGLLIDDSSGSDVIVTDLYYDYNLSELDYAFLSKMGRINCFDKRVFQRWINKLRNRVSEYEKSSFKSHVRYFAVQEYGTYTFRPHYHVLLFFDSQWLADNLQEIVASCWSDDSRAKNNTSIGRVDAQHVIKSASSYVAGYLCCLSDLPQFFNHPFLKPKVFCSRHPAIGTSFINSQEIKEVFFNASPRISVYNYRSQSIVDIPLPNSIRDRLFPKIKGFAEFSVEFLCRLFCWFEQKNIISFNNFLECVHEYCLSCSDTDLAKYFISLSNSYDSTLPRLYSVLRRISYNSYIFGVDSLFYAQQIKKYYDNCSIQSYKDYCVAVSDYITNHVLRVGDLMLIDPLKCDYFKNHDISTLSESDKTILNSFGWNEDDLVFDDVLNFDSCILYQQVLSKSSSFVGKIKKKRMLNEYQSENPKVSDYKSFNLINKFYYGET